jgi:hypothetical protein
MSHHHRFAEVDGALNQARKSVSTTSRARGHPDLKVAKKRGTGDHDGEKGARVAHSMRGAGEAGRGDQNRVGDSQPPPGISRRIREVQQASIEGPGEIVKYSGTGVKKG